ncbi:MAG: CAP domain-containing protein [Gemmataceae bacterium]|nr:CAP domain-containing protein [Gemmataceae bacterium]MDW8243971.1 CAP domain-containing protein [Thermogemmata sp.]
MRRGKLAVMVVVFLASSGAGGIVQAVWNDAPSVAASRKTEGEVELTPEEQELLELTNAERRRWGLRPLRPHPLLMLAARRHAANMARQGRLSHTLDGKTFVDRVVETGYSAQPVSENIAWNPATPATALRCWLASPGHRANLLGACDEVGLAVATNERGERFWVQVFGLSVSR